MHNRYYVFVGPNEPDVKNGVDGNDPTKEVVLYWSKPAIDGEVIEGYEISYQASSDGTKLSNDFVPHKEKKESYEFTKSTLREGELYAITITARNSAGIKSDATTHRASKLV